MISCCFKKAAARDNTAIQLVFGDFPPTQTTYAKKFLIKMIARQFCIEIRYNFNKMWIFAQKISNWPLIVTYY